ncbi:MAG TPA: protein-L-isoaspartate(D-aspartate) O-methyltransferase [Bryobacteraceae bacterium]|jgi:protein-L-isoaspartate(D-aspartate) O-methyltransferase|nr:protein-L-isoaspartate(D-aspartate) O-methyltransferase [Bryobacteraceae bacterium]
MIPDWAVERRRMVERQLRGRGIRDPRVLRAMGEVPREAFVPLESRVLAYRDGPVPIGFGQTMSQPYMTALMAERLELTGVETVLEVGAGCGYASAVLGALAARVIAIELIPELAEVARANLRRAGRDANVIVIEGDGSAGYPAAAPFDAISVAAGAPEMPPSLLDQLAGRGRAVIPVGSRQDQELRVYTRRGGRTIYRVATQCRFVPLRGGEGWH